MHVGERQVISGVLTIEVRDAEGRLVEERRVPNLITRAGRLLAANLLMGQGGISELKRYFIVVGIGGKPKGKEAPSDVKLENPVAESEIKTIKVEEDRASDAVRATVSATLEALTVNTTQALSEAGIEIRYTVGGSKAEKTLFNRVTFEDVNRGPGMTLKLSWEISF